MATTSRPLVYLAGPDVFRPDATALGRRKKELCASLGLEALFPLDDLDLPTDLGDRPMDEQAAALFAACVELMDRCVAGLANLTPFRGPSADVGTVLELGYLTGQGKPVVGYTSDLRPYHQRVEADGLLVEPFGLCDNLMLEGAVTRAGVAAVRRASDDGDELGALTAFEAAAAHLARRLGTA